MVLIKSRTFSSPSASHLFRRVGDGEQRGRRLVDAGVGRLRRQHHRDQQRVGVDISQLGLRFRARLAEAAERFLHFLRRPGFRLASLRAASRPVFPGSLALGAGFSADDRLSCAFPRVVLRAMKPV